MLLPFLTWIDLWYKRTFFEILIDLFLLLFDHLLDLMLLPYVHTLEKGGVTVGQIACAMFDDRLEGALDVYFVLAALVLLE